MKNMRLVVFVVFAVCAFSLSAQAQKKWTYKGDNGTGGKITIIITQRPNGYEVSGEYKLRPSDVCKLRGSYLLAGRRLRATCVFGDGEKWEVTGFMQAGKDAFQVHSNVGGEIVAWRDGIKPKTTDSSTETSKKLIWQAVGSGDCAGNDVDSSDDSSRPKNEKAHEGYTAVCWNGNNRNNPGKAFCTYKSLPPEKCKGGTNTGTMYRAVRQ